jgi:hypothetical protein
MNRICAVCMGFKNVDTSIQFYRDKFEYVTSPIRRVTTARAHIIRMDDSQKFN